MKLFENRFNRNAWYFWLLTLCSILIGISSCNKEDMSDLTRPETTDDASLLAWQMNKFIKTRAEPYNIAIVTTGAEFNFGKLGRNGEIKIDWGDGHVDKDVLSHVYTDGEPAHTIFLYGDINTLFLSGKEIIFIDVVGAPNLEVFDANNNRISNIDLSNNKKLYSLNLRTNKLHSVDLSSNEKMTYLYLDANPLDTLDIRVLPLLGGLSVDRTNITELDISQNLQLMSLNIGTTNITSINCENNTNLSSLTIDNCPIKMLDLSKNTSLTSINAYNVSIATLDFSNNSNISSIAIPVTNIENIILPSNPKCLRSLAIYNSSIENNLRKLTALMLSLPDCSIPDPITGEIRKGSLFTSSPYISTIESLLEGYNWNIIIM